MKRRHRLSDKARFRQVRQEGTSYAHPLIVLCCLPNSGTLSRVGFTVSRRIGKAVERNRARRRMSESVRLLWDRVIPGWDMVWIARPGINRVEFSELHNACARLLRRARLLDDTGRISGEPRLRLLPAAASSPVPQTNGCEDTVSGSHSIL